MMLPSLRVLGPATWSALSGMLGVGADAALYMGGTDLIPRLRAREVSAAVVIDLKGLPGMRQVQVSNDMIEIGAAVTYREILVHPGISAALPALVQMVGGIGNVRVRTSGTLGGSVAAAAAAADPATLLLALDASIGLRGPGGSRHLPIDDFLLGAGRTALGVDEVVTSVRVPIPPAATQVTFSRLSFGDGPVVNAALLRGPGACRLVVGATADRPQRVVVAESAAAHAATASQAGRMTASVIAVRADAPAPEAYIRRAVAAVVERLVSAPAQSSRR